MNLPTEQTAFSERCRYNLAVGVAVRHPAELVITGLERRSAQPAQWILPSRPPRTTPAKLTTSTSPGVLYGAQLVVNDGDFTLDVG